MINAMRNTAKCDLEVDDISAKYMQGYMQCNMHILENAMAETGHMGVRVA